MAEANLYVRCRPCSSDRPNWRIQSDVLIKILKRDKLYSFYYYIIIKRISCVPGSPVLPDNVQKQTTLERVNEKHNLENTFCGLISIYEKLRVTICEP